DVRGVDLSTHRAPFRDDLSTPNSIGSGHRLKWDVWIAERGRSHDCQRFWRLQRVRSWDADDRDAQPVPENLSRNRLSGVQIDHANEIGHHGQDLARSGTSNQIFVLEID